MTPASATPTRASETQRDVTALGASSTRSLGVDSGFRSAWAEAFARLSALRQLSAGWDGANAEPVWGEAISAAERFMSELAAAPVPAPAVVPLADGGVQLEWWQGERRLEIEFDTDRDVVFVCDDPHLQAGIDGQLPKDRDLLYAALQRTFAAQ